MGFYINQDMPTRGKAEALVKQHGAVELRSAIEAADWMKQGFGIVCVVSNPLFDAAGYCFNERELSAFSDPMDARHRSWLAMDKTAAEKLSGFSQ